MYVTAYLWLDTERGEFEHIPWSAYIKYGEYYGLTRDQVDWLLEIGLEVDNAIINDRVKRAKNGNA